MATRKTNTKSPFLVEARQARWLGKKFRRAGNTMTVNSGLVRVSCFPTVGGMWAVCIELKLDKKSCRKVHLTDVRRKKLQAALNAALCLVRCWHVELRDELWPGCS